MSGVAGEAGRDLVEVATSPAAASVEDAIERFEDARCSLNVCAIHVLERQERAEGTLVSYRVDCKYSVFDDSEYFEGRALVRADDRLGQALGEARLRVVAAAELRRA